MTEEERRKVAKNAKQYYEIQHQVLSELATSYQIHRMREYLDTVHKACSKILRKSRSGRSRTEENVMTTTTTTNNDSSSGSSGTVGFKEDGRFGQLLRCRWGLHDVVFQTGDGSLISAHRVILCARSTYFRAMLAPDSKFAEASMDQIPVLVEEGLVFSIILRYMYTGMVSEEFDPGNAFDLLNASHMYGLIGLQTQAEDYIARECVEIGNVVEVLNATCSIHVPRLRMAAVACLIVNFDYLLEEEGDQEVNMEEEDDEEEEEEKEKENGRFTTKPLESVEDIMIQDDWLKEFVIDRYYHWNQGRLWGRENKMEENEEKNGEDVDERDYVGGESKTKRK